MTVYNFGSINIDHVYQVDHFVQPGETLSSLSLDTVLGGKGANQSVALARAGVAVRHVGRVSAADAWVVDSIRDFGVDVSCIEQIDSPSGHAIIQVDKHGENAIVLHGGANQGFDAQTLDRLLDDACADDWLLLQNECNALEHAMDIAARKKMHIAFNPAPMSNDVNSLPLERCRILCVNEIEAAALAGTDDETLAAQELQQRFPETQIVLTLGSRGARLLHQGTQVDAASPKVTVVDTTGAGDTFVGYYLAAIIENHSAQTALVRACAAGALAVTRHGATPGIPTAADVDNMMNSNNNA